MTHLPHKTILLFYALFGQNAKERIYKRETVLLCRPVCFICQTAQRSLIFSKFSKTENLNALNLKNQNVFKMIQRLFQQNIFVDVITIKIYFAF